ncbi:MAG: peroxiredoxin family protein [Candidatus Cryptobacteroides sp.]
MKRTLLFILFALAVQSAALAQLPSVKVSLASNKKFDTKNLVDGKTPVVIAFWSISCDPCIQEIDALNEAYDGWQEEVPFTLVLVSTDDTRFTAQARAFAKTRGWSDFVCLYDVNNDFIRAMNVVFTPHSFVLSPDGKIVHSQTGYNPGAEEEILTALKKLEISE